MSQSLPGIVVTGAPLPGPVRHGWSCRDAGHELDAIDLCRHWDVGRVESTDSLPCRLAGENARSGWGAARLGIIEQAPDDDLRYAWVCDFVSRIFPFGMLITTAVVIDQKNVTGYEGHWAPLEPGIAYGDAARGAIERVVTDWRSIT